MKTITVDRDQFQTDEDITERLISASKGHPGKYVTHNLFLRRLEIYVHDHKPGSLSIAGAENTFRYYGGFYRDGEIVRPSDSFVAKYDYCPVSR